MQKPSSTNTSTWHIVNTRCDACAIAQHNSVFTISNGYVGLKGNLQQYHQGHCAVTLLAGVFDELDMFGLLRCSNQPRRYLDPNHFDTAGRSPAVANLPDPLMVRLFLEDREVSLTQGRVSDFSQTLELATGVYRYAYEFRDAAGRAVRVESFRFAQLDQPHRVLMRYTVTPLEGELRVRLLTGIDGSTYSNVTGERQFAITEMRADPPARCILHARTLARGHRIQMGLINVPRTDARLLDVRGVVEHNRIYSAYEFLAKSGQPVTIDRFIAITCSEDARHGVASELEAQLQANLQQGMENALQEQHRSWQRLWQRADVQIEGDDTAQRYLRFCLYHVLAAAPRHSDKLSVPVKLLSGEYYQGTIFYDTDLYIEPFYLMTFPELARTCLNYRYHGLQPGRQIARELGFEGVKFAWQAGPYGEECLGRWWRFTHTNIHINADVAYSLMQYYLATGDERFMRERGIDILVETARFYASRVVYDPARDAYDIHDVAGPDEGHCESTNNFYTNYLAIRNLRWAAQMLQQLKHADPQAHRQAAQRLAIRDDEPAQWLHVAKRLTLLYDENSKLYEQCEGFYQLKPAPPELLRDRKEWFVTVFPYQALNEPDVLLAMFLFRDDFDADTLRANWQFYKNKSMNFSSMSFAPNSVLAAEMGDLEDAYRNFIITAGEDIDEQLTGRHDTCDGLHGTASGGAWMAAVFGFGGVCLSEKTLRISPKLPPQWKKLRFKLVLRGKILSFAIDHERISIDVGNERNVEISATVAGQTVTLKSGQKYRITCR